MAKKVTISLMALAFAGLLIALNAQLRAEAPEPSIVPKSWTLDFSHSKPQPIALRTLKGEIQWYWYMTYKVENNTGEDLLFIPDITIANDQGQILTSNQNVPSKTFKAIQDRERNPLLLSPPSIIGRLLQGADFAKESVAIWPHNAKDDITDLTIFVAGLSGETATIKHPSTDETVVLRKSLMISYQTPGNLMHPQRQAFIPHGTTWIMR